MPGRGPKCYNCGDFGHISADCEYTTSGPKCYSCGGFGHLARDCGSPVDEGLENPQLVENIVLGAGLRGRQAANLQSQVLFYINPATQVCFDIYYATRTVKWFTQSPSQDQAFKQRTYRTRIDLTRLLETSTASTESHERTAAAKAACAACGVEKERSDFSVAQWKRRSDGAKCKVCTASKVPDVSTVLDDEEGSKPKRKTRSGGGRGPKCYNCGEFGHLSRDCQHTSAANGSDPKCYTCGGFGHLARDCEQATSAPKW